MSRASVERRLTEVHARLKRARQELSVLDQQLATFNDVAEDTRVRALVSEDPMASREHREAQRHADAMTRSRAKVMAAIAELELSIDSLLQRLGSESR